MRELRRREDPVKAGRLSDLLRRNGIGYDEQCRLYALANDIDERTATDEWEALMQEAEAAGA